MKEMEIANGSSDLEPEFFHLWCKYSTVLLPRDFLHHDKLWAHKRQGVPYLAIPTKLLSREIGSLSQYCVIVSYPIKHIFSKEKTDLEYLGGAMAVHMDKVVSCLSVIDIRVCISSGRNT